MANVVTATRCYESAVINASIEDVWNKISGLDFSFMSLVTSAEDQKVDGVDTGKLVGSTVCLTYDDGTVQTYERREISNIHHFVTYELLTSEPAVTYTSQILTIRLRPITTTNETFAEWVSDFSNDATAEVIQDSKYKKQEGFKELRSYFDSESKEN